MKEDVMGTNGEVDHVHVTSELYRKHRPTSFKRVIGQPEACRTLASMVKAGKVPHAIMFVGPSGCGKTTLAGILRTKLGCSENDFQDINAASNRGIDMVRSIDRRMGLAALGGSCRIWLLDEAHKASSDAQTALLKVLEDPPDHVYFFLCTTHPQGLLPTIRTRCTEIRLKPLSEADLKRVMEEALEAEGLPPASDELYQRIAEVAEGSARKALVLLGQVIGIPDEQERLDAVLSSDLKKDVFELVRMLLWRKATWPEVANFLKGLDTEDWEGLRRLVLANATNELLKGGKGAERAFAIIRYFESNYYDVGKAGLVRDCYATFEKR